IGSITRPASFCGVTGFKPSAGRIDPDGVIPFSPTADHVGVIAADVATASRCAAVLVRDWHAESADTTHAQETIAAARRAKSPEKGISAVPPGLRDLLRTRIGPVLVPDDAYLAQADADGIRGLESAVERLSGLGVPVQRVSIMDDISDINAAHTAMIAREFAAVHRFWETEFGEFYHERSRELISRGGEIGDDAYRAAVSGGPVFRKRLEAALERHGASLWLAPATTGEAPESLAATGNPIMNLPWTYAGLPTVGIPVFNLPHGCGPAGLPLGVQLAAAHGRDEWLLYAVTLIEAAFG
ncbi:MAG: amidase family protein, partial [Spirochaeta sp.]|nr:amidase family protein [Spirochaeta sp.]